MQCKYIKSPRGFLAVAKSLLGWTCHDHEDVTVLSSPSKDIFMGVYHSLRA